MANKATQLERVATIGEITRRFPSKIGRTGLMKCLYFLEVIRGVPLGYSFRLYTYGPFDSGVLDDLRYAEALDVVTSTPVYFSGGYGYEIESSDRNEDLIGRSEEFVKKYRADVDWVIDMFASKSAASLEILSTLIYVERESREANVPVSVEKIVASVRDIKPHHSEENIRSEADWLRSKDLLAA